VLPSLFWFSVILIVYTFFGYALLIGLAARLFPRPHQQSAALPPVTLLIAAYNGVVTQYQPQRQGKVAAVNRVAPFLTDPIVIFTDANSMLAPASIRMLVRHFADPVVAAVAGEKQVRGGGEGLYWRYESFLKCCDSAVSSVMGAAGELFALRRSLFVAPEADSIIEDFVMSMRLVQAGWRVIYEPDAVAWEEPIPTLRGEWLRRTRIAAGGWQAMRRLRGLLAWPWNRITWQYVSHRVLRWAVTPLLLPLALATNLLLWSIPFYRLLSVAQIAFYLLALAGFARAKAGKRGGVAYTAFFFVFTNLAALAGLGRGVTNRQPVTWAKTR